MTRRLLAILELLRPANIVTAFADILAGFAAAGGILLVSGWSVTVIPGGLPYLLLSTFGLYGGGVVLNDLFDADLDATERPERAIPSGRISRGMAAFLGLLLLTAGVTAAFQSGVYSGYIALAIAFFVLLYDAIAKHSALFGPLCMGLCRGGNLLLGVSIVPVIVTHLWFLALIPMLYIGSITLVSRGEVHGGNRIWGMASLLSLSLVTAALVALALLPYYELGSSLPFILLFALLVIPPFFRSARSPEPDLIRTAVKRGVLCLIILNSALAAGFAGFWTGLFVLALLPLSILLGKLFSVT